MLKQLTPFAVAGSLCACASTPPVDFHYYSPTSETTLSMTQTIDCSTDGDNLIVSNSPSVTTAFVADASASRSLPAKALDNTFADADVTVTLSEDGRLKTINATSTGQGQAIISSAVTLLSDAAKLGAGTQHAATKPASNECKFLKNWGNGKPVTLTFTKNVNLGDPLPPRNKPFEGGVIVLGRDETNSPLLYDGLKGKLPPIDIRVSLSKDQLSGGSADCNTKDGVPLKLRSTVDATIKFRSDGHALGLSTVTVPGNQDYCIAIPKAELFGNGKFALTLADSGAITSLEYGKTSGEAAALSTAGTVITTFAPASSTTTVTTGGTTTTGPVSPNP